MSGGVRKLGGDVDPNFAKRLVIKKSHGDAVWHNSASQVIDVVTAVIPYKILCAMCTLESMIERSSDEYGLFLKGKYERGILYVEEDYYIPEQEVSAASIDFKEEPPEGFNGVIHRHPARMRNFSKVDDDSINQNFEFSLLFTDKDIVNGVVNLEVADGYGKVQLPCDIEIQYPFEEIDQGIVDDKIYPRVVVSKSYPKYNSYNPNKPTTSKALDSREDKRGIQPYFGKGSGVGPNGNGFQGDENVDEDDYVVGRPSPPLQHSGGIKRFDNKHVAHEEHDDNPGFGLDDDPDEQLEKDTVDYLNYLTNGIPDEDEYEDDDVPIHARPL
jgi:hypothetical protein